MSTPTERTRALVWAGGLLIEISRNTQLPLALRRQAATIARHYPTVGDIARVASRGAGDPFGLEEVTEDALREWSSQLAHGPLTDATRLTWPE